MKKLIEKIKTGNVKAFKKMYNLKKDDGFQICLAICKDRDDATEACQKGFIRVYRSIQSLQETRYFESWFYRIMMNCCYDILKARKFDEINMETSFAKSTDYDDYFHRELLLKALEDLPDGYRTVFIMHFFQDMKHSDIGKILQCSSETSRSQYSRAKQKIKNVLTQKMELNFEEI